jgi:hypothetical protein
MLAIKMDHNWPVELLKRQYLQLIDPEQLELPCKELLRLPLTQARIFDEILNESALEYLPPKRYKSRALKRLVNALEEAIEDPEEDVWLLRVFLPLCSASLLRFRP